MTWSAEAPQGNEWAKIVWELPLYTRGRGLDIGCGPQKAFPHFIGVDSKKDKQLFNIDIKPDVDADATNLCIFSDQSMDFVFSSHLLEHIDDYKKALREWWRLLKPMGFLLLYLPHKRFYPNIGEPGSNPDHKHDFLPEDIESAMKDIGSWDLVRNEERCKDDEYSFFQVFQKLKKGEGHKHSYKKPKPAKTCAVVRYGAWGDALQMSSVLPGLKKQGYHITLYTTPRAWEVVKGNPHIDAVYLQDTDQVPNHTLGEFWEHEEKKYDKWVNLSESVEGTWLQINRVGSPFYNWPHAVRDKYMRGNYIEFQHEIAQVPYERPEVRFFPTIEEKNWVFEQKRAMVAEPLILWVLNGSSPHKVWPHMDQVFARILLTWPKAKIVTVGDQKSRMLDEPWQKEPRVLRKAGEWSIRETLAFAQQCDIVVGPETGVLSAVSVEKLPKVVFLSHSSHENLTRDWVNTFVLFSTKTKCYPCHVLHYDWSKCMRNSDKIGENDAPWAGTAQCQVDIPADACWAALCKALGKEIELPAMPGQKQEAANAPAVLVPASAS